MTTKVICEVEVCTDCYFAHHYGYSTVQVLDDNGVPTGAVEYFSGDSDEPTENEPLGLLSEYELTDNDPGEGFFSWSSCDGCGSRLGGQRFTMAAWA